MEDSRLALRASREAISGVLLIDKPLGLGSTAVLARVKYLLGAKKAGHTGTLDPLATGLLPVCLGEATKFASDLLFATKRYRATLVLGATTTTGDAEGEVLERREVACDAAEIDRVLQTFRGVIDQVPPMFSALKREGKPLYAYARAGVTLERMARQVEIEKLERVSYSRPELVIDVTCSKGTYVRTLGEDIGQALSCGAHLSALRRLAVAGISIEKANTLPELEAMSLLERRARLLPLDALIAELPVLELDDTLSGRFRAGQRLAGFASMSGRFRVYALKASPHNLMGIGLIEEGVLRPKRLLASNVQPGDFSAGRT